MTARRYLIPTCTICIFSLSHTNVWRRKLCRIHTFVTFENKIYYLYLLAYPYIIEGREVRYFRTIVYIPGKWLGISLCSEWDFHLHRIFCAFSSNPSSSSFHCLFYRRIILLIDPWDHHVLKSSILEARRFGRFPLTFSAFFNTDLVECL